MKKIPLGGRCGYGKYALVDDQDFEALSLYKWWLSANGYAYTKPYKSRGFYMHRLILGITDGNIDVDHVNHKKLDNRRSNLRSCTRSQNSWNSLLQCRSKSSRYKGVCWDKRRKKWVAYINQYGKRKYLGYFKLEDQAALAYNEMASNLHGDFALINTLGG